MVRMRQADPDKIRNKVFALMARYANQSDLPNVAAWLSKNLDDADRADSIAAIKARISTLPQSLRAEVASALGENLERVE